MALNDITNITNENIPPGVNTKEDPTPAAPATTTTTTATTTSTPASAVANMTVPLHSANAELKNKDKERQRSDSAVTSSTQGGGNAAKGLEHLENFTCKHPLMNEWTLWFTKPPTGRNDNWNDLLKEVVTFDSVEEFWGLHQNLAPTSQLTIKCDYHLFKHGVRPEWEDPKNKHGGKWSFTFRDKANVPVDDLWLHTQLAAIGETLEGDDDDEVMGVVVNVRKTFYRIGLWTRTVGKSTSGKRSLAGDGSAATDATDEAADPPTGGGGGGGNAAAAATSNSTKDADAEHKERLFAIGKRFKEVLRLKDDETLEFVGHVESAQTGSSRAKTKYTV